METKDLGVPRQAEVALGFLCRLRPQIISTFGTTRVVGRQQYAPAAFTPGEIPGTHFQRLSRSQGTWFCRKEPQKKSPVTSQRLKHYATTGPQIKDLGKTQCLSTLKLFYRTIITGLQAINICLIGSIPLCCINIIL